MPTFLYLTHEVPWPPDAGHKIRGGQLVNALSKLGEVYVAAFTDRPEEADERPTLAGVLIKRRELRIRRRPVRLGLTLAQSFLRGEPYGLMKFADRGFRRQLANLIRNVRPDFIVSTLPMLQHLPPWAADHSAIVMDTHNIEHELWADFAAVVPRFLRPFMAREIRLLGDRERAYWASAEAVIAICDEDAVIIARWTGERPTVVPVAVHLGEADRRPSAGPTFDVGLVGVWSWAPNEDALAWFSSDILPGLCSRGLSVAIAGRGVSPALARSLKRQGAEVLGFVDDLDDFYQSVRVIAAPYRLGGGVRMKVLEAIDHRIPVVGTPLAFRGLRGAEEAWTASTSSEMIDQIERLLRSEEDRSGAVRSQARAVQRHAVQVGEAALTGLVERLTKVDRR